MPTVAATETAGASAVRKFLLCEQCQAPVDPEQRYCVRCGARQTHASNPAVDYFAVAARRRRIPGAPVAEPGRLRAPLIALALVLLPLAVAAGVLVGRGGSTNDAKLISALQNQRPLVVTAPTAATSTAPTTTATTATTASSTKTPTHSHGAAVVAHTAYGTVHKLVGAAPTRQQLGQDKKVVEKINKTVGKSYVNAQRGLPDTIAVTGNPNSSPQPSKGAGEP
jgi:hypothetical protein